MNRILVLGLLVLVLAGCGGAQPTTSANSGGAPTPAPPSTVPPPQASTAPPTAPPAADGPPASSDLADLIWQESDLPGVTATPLQGGAPAPNPAVAGVQLQRGTEPVGAIVGMTLPSAAAAQAQIEQMQQAS